MLSFKSNTTIRLLALIWGFSSLYTNITCSLSPSLRYYKLNTNKKDAELTEKDKLIELEYIFRDYRNVYAEFLQMFLMQYNLTKIYNTDIKTLKLELNKGKRIKKLLEDFNSINNKRIQLNESKHTGELLVHFNLESSLINHPIFKTLTLYNNKDKDKNKNKGIDVKGKGRYYTLLSLNNTLLDIIATYKDVCLRFNESMNAKLTYCYVNDKSHGFIDALNNCSELSERTLKAIRGKITYFEQILVLKLTNQSEKITINSINNLTEIIKSNIQLLERITDEMESQMIELKNNTHSSNKPIKEVLTMKLIVDTNNIDNLIDSYLNEFGIKKTPYAHSYSPLTDFDDLNELVLMYEKSSIRNLKFYHNYISNELERLIVHNNLFINDMIKCIFIKELFNRYSKLNGTIVTDINLLN